MKEECLQFDFEKKGKKRKDGITRPTLGTAQDAAPKQKQKKGKSSPRN